MKANVYGSEKAGDKFVDIVQVSRGRWIAREVGIYEWTGRKRDGVLYLRKIGSRGLRWAKTDTGPLVRLADAIADELGCERPTDRDARLREEHQATADLRRAAGLQPWDTSSS